MDEPLRDPMIDRPDVRYVRHDGVAIAYQVFGDGPIDLVCIPGFVSNLIWNWELTGMRSMLDRLASFARVIILDRRGVGLSDRFSPDDLPSLEVLAADVLAVMDDVGVARVSVFGWQSGASIAILLAASYPERVSQLVLFSPDPCPSTKPDWPYGWSDDEWTSYLDGIRLGWGTRPWLDEHFREFAPGSPVDPVTAAAFLLAASPSTAEAIERLDMQTDVRAVLPSVHTPTLVVYRSDQESTPIEARRYVVDHIPNAVAGEVPGRDEPPYTEAVEEICDEVEAFLTGVRHEPITDRILATVLFTDVADSTSALATVGDARWADLLARHDEIARSEIDRHRGRYVDSTGDGLLATFDGPARAVRCALAIGDRVRPLGLLIRSGCHTGEVELHGDHVRGLAVHIAARVMNLAAPTEVVVSSTVKDLTAGSGLVFEHAGEHELKGVPDRWQVYRVVR